MNTRAAWLTSCLSAVAPPALAQTATVAVHPSQQGAVVTNKVLGVNMANWVDQTQPAIATALSQSRLRAVRWPGGSASDAFHWQGNTGCNGEYVASGGDFGSFVASVVKPDKLDLAVTVNYGSNTACNAGGDPAEAAGWVAYAKSQGDAVSHWTVGNEVYGSWEYDLHSPAHDAATYASAVATGYYPAMKAANAAAKIGVVVNPGWQPAWDPTVLAQAKYDFVEYHWYAQQPGQESDSYLLTQAPQDLTTQINALKNELATAGHASTPIMVGELGSVSYNPGKQTSSITQALFAGQVLGELMNDGVARATWWIGFGGCADSSSGNFSSSLYGWQDFGGYMVFSDGTPEYGCPNATSVPIGTPLPTARAFQLAALVADTGAHMLATTLGGSSGSLRAYALTHGTGTALMLFNLDETAPLPVFVSVDGVASASKVLIDTYDKALYDQSQGNSWAGPSYSQLSDQSLPVTITLQPWSMTVVRLTP